MTDFLESMRIASSRRVEQLIAEVSVSDLKSRALSAPEALQLELSTFDIIAEIKTRSPSEGPITGIEDADTLKRRARRYQSDGAACISVLTEPESFAGKLEHLREVVSAVSVPVMRKDFLVHPAQVMEARSYGASGVLLITRILDDGAIEAMVGQARELGMFVLLENFDGGDLDRSMKFASSDVLVGLNCRDLRTLAVETSRFAELASLIPAEVLSVAESGMSEPGDVRKIAELGYNAALVGTALMRSKGEMLSAMLKEAREAATCL